jgi:hypothetical protein
LRLSYSNCTSHILLYPSAFLRVSSTDRHIPLKSMMPIRVRLVQLLKAEEASSLDRRHFARKSCSEDGILPGWSSCLGGLRRRSKPAVFLRNSCRVPRSRAGRGRTFLPLYKMVPGRLVDIDQHHRGHFAAGFSYSRMKSLERTWRDGISIIVYASLRSSESFGQQDGEQTCRGR